DDGAVLLDLRDGTYHLFDAVAAAMWQSLLRTGSEAETVAALHERFEVAAARLGADLATFLSRCRERDWLVAGDRCAEPSPALVPARARAPEWSAWRSLRDMARALRRE